jgi:DHA3 family macrolide efflux protein-like MFS transporter
MMSMNVDGQGLRPLWPFLAVWAGQAVSLLGSQLVQFAVVWWLTGTTDSATVLAWASLVALLPQIVLGPFAGALVDRWRRRWVMIAADTGVAVATLVLALLFRRGLASVGWIYLLLLIRAAGAAFHWPAMQASTALMVPQAHLARVAGLNQALLGLASIAIPPAGAFAVESLPMAGVLAIDVATAVPAVVSLLLVAIPQPAQIAAGCRPSVWADMKQGLHFVLGWPALMMLVGIGVVVNMLGRAAGSLAPLLVMQHFRAGAAGLGWFQAAVGVGTVVGGAVLGLWGGLRRRVVTQMLALAADGLIIMLVALSPRERFVLAVALIGVTGLLEAIVLGLSGAIFQALVPPEVQGRVFALSISVTQGLAPLGLLVAGPVADAVGVHVWWALTGAVIALIGAGAFLVPSVIGIEDSAYRPAVA